MESIAHNKRYLPHEISAKKYLVKLYRETKDMVVGSVKNIDKLGNI